jgi:hypothetical protein
MDGECGQKNERVVKCPNSACCSKYNWCGYGPEFCGPGCQGAYGSCNDHSSPKPASISTSDGKCGQQPDGSVIVCALSACCSQFNWCGHGLEFCGSGCQALYGQCH